MAKYADIEPFYDWLIELMRLDTSNYPDHQTLMIYEIMDELDSLPEADMVEVPCKIGDWVWAIRDYKGHKHPQRGIVSEMYFSTDMSLHIVVKHIARGKWGETIFATDKEAYAAIEGRKANG